MQRDRDLFIYLLFITKFHRLQKSYFERSKRRSYFLSLVFITKCFTKNLLLRKEIKTIKSVSNVGDTS